MTIRYGVHPSRELVEIFRRKPYQGADPERASVLILGNDANYSPEISHHSFFNRILEYHEDGVRFWRSHSVHHPFLHCEYPFARNRGGVTYHRNVAKMGLTSRYAEAISFVELLSVPTIGNTSTDRRHFFELMDSGHLEWLEDLVLDGRRKFVLVNRTLINNIQAINKKFGTLVKLHKKLESKSSGQSMSADSPTVIYCGYSFSHTVTNNYLDKLGANIRNFIHETNPLV